MWTCPECGRRFGRNNQGHECLAVVPLADWLDAEEPWVADVCRAVVDVVDALGDDHVVEPAEVGLLIKRRSTIIEARPRRKWVDVTFKLPGRVEHPRIARAIGGGSWTYHVVKVADAGEVDADLAGWLAESYSTAEPAA